MNGILKCSRYAFGPNKLHLCGPDANREILDYISSNAQDLGLENLLKAFRTMYPYLCLIAEANKIKDPFDEKVVEAYWIGNNLLETIEKKRIYRHLLEKHNLKKLIGRKDFEKIIDKIKLGAVPHHSFHVLNVWKRTGHLNQTHTPETIDSCRISWGKIEQIEGPFVTVNTEVLLYQNGKFILSEPILRKVIRPFQSGIDIEELKPGDLVSIHWGIICEPITERQLKMLKKYTLKHIELANTTL